MNIVSGNTSNADECYRLIAATMSVFSEYLLTSTFKIKSASTQALRLIITHGLAKLTLSPSDFQAGSGFQKVYMNLRYLISSRFQETKSMEASFQIIKAFIGKLELPNELHAEFLLEVSAISVKKNDYQAWTSCIGTFMAKMGAFHFFKVLPLELIKYDLNSLTYAQDSRSWLLPLVSNHLKKDANLDFFVEYFLPMIMQIDKMRELEKKSRQSEIKVKKYETMLVQIWQLLPQFCSSNSPNMSNCFVQVLKYLEPILNKDLLGLRMTALKTFSALISHCRNTKVIDDEIKKTRKGLSNIAMDYIQGLVTLYTEDQTNEAGAPKQITEKH